MDYRIIWVPGMHPKPEPDMHIPQLWRCLVEGVRRADPAAGDRLAENGTAHFRIADWNREYYHRSRDITTEIPWIDSLLHRHGPSERDIREALTWRTRLAWLAYHLADLVPALIGVLPDRTIRDRIGEIVHYFDNRGGAGDRIRQPLVHQLQSARQAGERVLLIGHSLGSVIAYDALWVLTHRYRMREPVDLFLSVGSPLGVRYVQKRLLGAGEQGEKRFPHNIRQWWNIAAVGDLTALDPVVADDFAEMIELGLVESIDNPGGRVYTYYRDEKGLNPHKSYGYLAHPATGHVVAEWIRGSFF